MEGPMNETTITPSKNLKVWYARGFSARLKSPDFPEGTNFKGDPERRDAFRHGWDFAHLVQEVGEDPRAHEREIWAEVNERKGEVSV
jgi:hypothetical protein